MSLDAPGWAPAIREGLQAMIARHGRSDADWRDDDRPVAVFDWDNTCMAGDVSEAVMHHIDPGLVAEYADVFERDGRRRAYAWCAEVMGDRTPAEVRTLTHDAVEEAEGRGTLAYRREIAELVLLLRDAGWQPWVVSASEQTVVRAAAERLGFEERHVIGVQLHRDGNRLSRRALEPLPMEQGKVDLIDRHVGKRPMFAAGDNDTDLAMLHAARYRLVIDRGHPAVRHAAEQGGWWVQTGWQVSTFV